MLLLEKLLDYKVVQYDQRWAAEQSHPPWAAASRTDRHTMKHKVNYKRGLIVNTKYTGKVHCMVTDLNISQLEN